MKIRINGESREVRDSASVAALLSELGLARRGIAVELNGEIVPRTNYEATTLRENDTLEIVRMVGGG